MLLPDTQEAARAQRYMCRPTRNQSAGAEPGTSSSQDWKALHAESLQILSGAAGIFRRANYKWAAETNGGEELGIRKQINVRLQAHRPKREHAAQTRMPVSLPGCGPRSPWDSPSLEEARLRSR